MDALRGLDPVRVENPCHPGTPDINFAEGWIELKKAARWPPKGGVLALPHFTPQQRIWLRRRFEVGGNVYLLLQVRDDWLLFRGDKAAEWVGRGDREQLLSAATFVWDSASMKKDLKLCLLKR